MCIITVKKLRLSTRHFGSYLRIICVSVSVYYTYICTNTLRICIRILEVSLYTYLMRIMTVQNYVQKRDLWKFSYLPILNVSNIALVSNVE